MLETEPRELRVYTKEQPDLVGFLAGELGLRYNEDACHDNIRAYLWHPEDERNPVFIYEVLEMGFPCPFPAQNMTALFHGYGNDLPKPLFEKMQRDEGVLRADKEMFRLQRELPDIERIMPEFAIIRGILEFTKGERVYWTYLGSSASASSYIKERMEWLAEFLADKYDGIVADVQKGKLIL